MPIQAMRLRRPSGAATSLYWNPSDKGSAIILSNGNATSTNANAFVTWHSVRSGASHGSGKWYAEEVMDANAASSNIFGVGTSAAAVTNYCGSDAFGWGIQNDASSTVYNNAGTTVTALSPPSVNQRSMVAYDAASGKIWLGAKGVWAGSGDPAAGTNPTFTITPGTVLFLLGSKARSAQTGTLKNQVGENAHTIPSGFSMWG